MGIPRPLVRLNQSFIVLTSLLGLLVNHWILLLPFAVGVVTLIYKKNPIIRVSRNLLRKPMSAYVMEDPDQQLFNQWIATICLGLSLVFFAFRLNIVATIFSIMVILAAGVAIMGFCIGCTIRFRYKMWKYHRSMKPRT